LDWEAARESIFAGIIIKNGKNLPRKTGKMKGPDGLKLDMELGLGLRYATAAAPF
jgi:hypothetical protein